MTDTVAESCLGNPDHTMTVAIRLDHRHDRNGGPYIGADGIEVVTEGGKIDNRPRCSLYGR